jgi:hypothetical protein
MPLTVPWYWFSALQAEPILNQECGVTDSQAFLAAHEINDAASPVAVPETDPAIPGSAHTELRVIVARMDGTGSTQIVSAAMQLLQESIPVQNLDHGDRPLERIEANELGFHGAPF